MKKRIIKRLITIFIISAILIFDVAYAPLAKTDFLFKNISIEEGLSQATVETIIQDNKGYIWLGTNDGLNRYNGYSFKVYRKEKDKNRGISNNYIMKIAEDKDGNIWAATLDGMNKINNEKNTIEKYYENPNEGNLSSSKLTDILITKDNKMLVASYGGVDIYNETTNSFKPFIKDVSLLKNETVFALAEDNEGNIWVGTDLGLDKFDSSGEPIKDFTYNEEYKDITNKSVKDVYCDKDGIIWAGTFNNGMYKIDTHNKSIKSYKNNKDDKESIPSNYIRNFFRDKDDNFWICSGEGLLKYNDNNDNFTVINNNMNDKRSLLSDVTFVTFQDSYGLIWVGTYSGISIFDPNNKVRTYKRNPNDSDNSLSDDALHGIYEDNRGLIWVGTNSKGVNIIDRERNKIDEINTKILDGFSNDSINVITGHGDYVYIGTNNGLNIFNSKTRELKVIDKEDGLIDKFVKNLFYDSKGYLWIGTAEGFNILNLNDYSIMNITPMLKEANIKDIYSGAIFQDRDGTYWLGTFYNGGLIKINPDKKEIKAYRKDAGNNKSISDNAVRSIAEDDYGNLWVGTRLGLNKFNKKSEEFTSYTTSEGLSNNTIYGVLMDKDNNPWVSTNSGISKFDVSKNNFVNLDITDGLQSNEFNGECYFKSKSGEFFFGGINGLNVFKPEELVSDTKKNKVVFDEFKVNGIIENNINGKSFSSNQNTINVGMFLPNYKNTKNIRYYYSLENSSSDNWVEMDTNEITLSNLSSGKYHLKIKARDNNGVMSEESDISFSIKAPFWRSKLAFMLYMLIIVLLYFYEKDKLKRLDGLVEVRTKELNDEMSKNKELFHKVLHLERTKNNYFVNLSHELRTPLNVLSSTQQLITDLNKSENGIEKDKLSKYMDVTKRNINRLLKLINDIIDSSKIEHGSYKINLKEQNIVYIVEEAALSLKSYVEEQGLTLIIDPYVEEKNIICDGDQIERCIVNLVSNAAKHTPSGGKIEVCLFDLGAGVKIQVKDTGEGIDPKNHEIIFNRFSQVVDKNAEAKGGSGLGLTITKQIIDLHGGGIFVESDLGKGSIFTIVLPVDGSNL